MKNKNEKGFALVLSLVLLLVMSLMGGALIVISAGDHQSNNTSDQYQQTFYVAETSLLEGEKYLLNQFLGPWDTTTHARNVAGRNLPVNATTVFTGAMSKENYTSSDGFNADTGTICYNSFPDIDRAELKVVVAQSWNFGKLIRDSFSTNASVSEQNEADNHLKKFYYEFFITRIGAAPFRGYGASVKKSATNTGNNGMAFRIYGCGMFKERFGAPLNGITMVIPLESTIILPQ